MKTLAVITFTFIFGAAAIGQEARVVASIASGDAAVKNSPFSAEAISESVQVLADGNRIVRNATTKIYRNSEGQIRRETLSSSGNVLGTVFTNFSGITISDPALGQRIQLDRELKVARATALKSLPSISVVTTRPVDAKAATDADARLKGEMEASRTVLRQAETNSQLAEEAAVAAGSVARFTSLPFGSHSKFETRTEQLGSQIFEGVEAEGTRTYTTIPEGAIGNERPIEIVYERWHSKELQMTVYSRHNDPRFGEQTYRLSNILRSEPDPALFTVPQGYKITSDPGSGFRIRSNVEQKKAADRARSTKP